MSDPFVDALHDRLKSTGASTHGGERDRERGAALAGWWEEFVEVLGQKVGAWNERQAPQAPINFTKHADGAANLWHRRAEAAFTRDGDAVRISTRVGAEPERQAILALRMAPEGNVVALAEGNVLGTPAAAAEHLLTPLFIATFEAP